MIFYFYATCVAVIFFDFGSSIPVSPVTPYSTCPPTYILQNGLCYPQNVAQPCSTCQTAVTPTTTPPCQIPCQNGVTQPPCSTCQTAVPVNPTLPCQTPVVPCQNGVTQPPCSTCQTAVTPIQTPPCQTPCQNGVTHPPCSTCQTAVPVNPTLPCQTPVVPCQNGVKQPPCSIGQPVCPNPTPSCSNDGTQPPCSTTTTSTTSSPPTTTTTIMTTSTTTTAQPRPDPIIRCPTGTILVNGYCHLIYCGSGIYRDGKCIVTICPEGTVWTGSMCEAPVSHEQASFNITNTIYTNVNRTNDNHQMNYTNNITIHITEIPDHETVTLSPTPYPESTTKSPTNCCIIVTPTACAWDGYRHNCRNRRYRQCGSICTSKYIYLTPPKVQVDTPPPIPTCMDNNCGYDNTPFYPDCSTCDNSVEERCATYCRRSRCQTRHCQEVDMRGYCDNYRGSIGCRRMDGCNQDWCNDYSDYQ